MLISGFS